VDKRGGECYLCLMVDRNHVLKQIARAVTRWGWGGLVLLAPLCLSAQTQGAGIRVPERDEKGVMTSLLTGEKARLFPGKPVMIEGLVIRFFEADGETVRMKMESPSCEYDDRRGRAISEDSVRISGNGFDIRGKGYVYTARDQRMEINSQVKVTLTQLHRPNSILPRSNSSPDPTP
jgi:hypothetical protein